MNCYCDGFPVSKKKTDKGCSTMDDKAWGEDPNGKDPNGKDQHEPGAKLDAGKPRPWLVLGAFRNAIKEVIAVGTYGATKYSDNGWLEVPGGQQRYMDAAFRHLLAGEIRDPESDLPHLAMAIWNLLAVLELRKRGLG